MQHCILALDSEQTLVLGHVQPLLGTQKRKVASLHLEPGKGAVDHNATILLLSSASVYQTVIT